MLYSVYNWQYLSVISVLNYYNFTIKMHLRKPPGVFFFFNKKHLKIVLKRTIFDMMWYFNLEGKTFSDNFWL